MFNTKIVLLLITLFFVITSFISQTTTTESDAHFVNDTDQDHLDFTDFKERGLPLVEKKAQRRVRPTNWFRFCYVFILPLIVVALSACLMFWSVRRYKKWKKEKAEARARHQQLKRSRSKSKTRTKSADKKEHDDHLQPTIPVPPPTPGTAMLTPMENLVSRSLTALAGRVGSGTKFRPIATRSYAEGVTIPDSYRSEEESNSDRRDGREATTTEESIEDDLDERPVSLVALSKIENVGSIRG
ncbi:unnamed protein product [Meloidogyne enterolobii]|uniref:Uncharacterized protein n=1 Tax=Meloidogyne enterolobii TaxID=390850 RepID=A0ACB1ANV1_MELEN